MRDKGKLTLLVVGATGSIGRHVVDVAVEQGHTVRALVRGASSTPRFPPAAQVVEGQITDADTLRDPLDGIDAVAFVHGSSGSKEDMETVDYGAVRNALKVLGTKKARIALMTAIGVTNRTGAYNRSTEAHDWKRRSERLVRASGLPYTIVSPGWFDYNRADEHRLVFLQGDTRQSGTPRDGCIARRQIAEVLVASLTSPYALAKTFELVAEKGDAQPSFDGLFDSLESDSANAIDAVRDAPNMPLSEEPARVIQDLSEVRSAVHR